ncbi:DUF3618 domain-containing protein [Actinomadura sp. DC4]|uniref:DUF3618 domain-containing protein n=1 Tax=Actinomadura sp. DC4 TaxID=3055069 RepID=UPI0025B00102|nr:DUF3618 domain-containing protein [Actinomadura sp. DC4]MDN3351676.1 DUF3618 domain-containing protein [Actinomadura sp. DC4]
MADKTRDPAVIESEIERTRDDLARSIDLLADRLSPKRVARRGMAKAKEEAGHVAADIGAMVRREPADRRSPLTGPVLIGAGLVATTVAVSLLLRRRRV